MKEGNEIRALSCAGNEEQARTFLQSSLVTPNPAYDIVTVPLESIRKDEIIVPESSVTKPAADAPSEPGSERQ
jgi:hypothetical protein